MSDLHSENTATRTDDPEGRATQKPGDPNAPPAGEIKRKTAPGPFGRSFNLRLGSRAGMPLAVWGGLALLFVILLLAAL
jgi:hypothetical protein